MSRQIVSIFFVLAIIDLVSGCAGTSKGPTPSPDGEPSAPAPLTPTTQKSAEPRPVVLAPPPALSDTPAGVDAAILMNTVRTLCSQKYSGRKTGTEGHHLAAAWIASMLDTYQIRRYPDVSPEGITENVRILEYSLKYGKPPKDMTLRNVLGFIPAKDRLNLSQSAVLDKNRMQNKPFILVVAHYDAEGIVENKIYPGADDNASGAAAVLEIARVFQKRPLDKMDIVILLSDGEEEGMLGARVFAHSEKKRLNQCALVVNLDMVGRRFMDFSFASALTSAKTGCACSTAGARFEPLVKRAAEELKTAVTFWSLEDMRVAVLGRGYGFYSDADVFDRMGLPALLFGDGLNSDYHGESDVADAIDAELLALRTRLAVAVIRKTGETIKK